MSALTTTIIGSRAGKRVSAIAAPKGAPSRAATNVALEAHRQREPDDCEQSWITRHHQLQGRGVFH